MKNILVCMCLLSLVACAKGKKGDAGVRGPQGPSAPVPVVDPVQSQINAIVADENAYRESLGQAALSLGLSCTVQAVGSGQFLSSSSPGYTAAAGVVTALAGSTSYSYLLLVGFNQANSNSGPNSVIDPQIQPLFLSNNYKIVCNGQLVVTSEGYHSFSMSNDDGAILTIDGTQVINNDGTHGVTTAVGTKNMRSDVVHTFQMQYAQSGGGQFALVLNMDGSVLPAINLYH